MNSHDFYSYIITPLGELLAIGGEKGLKKLFFPNMGNVTNSKNFSIKSNCSNINKNVSPDPNWVEDSIRLKQTSDEIQAYFNKELTAFSIPLDLQGTTFQKNVWCALMTIPFGAKISYKDIAEKIGNPKGYRAVGSAVGKNPIPIIIPCHRVIGSDGSLTGFVGGLDIKKYLLNLELLPTIIHSQATHI